MAHIPHLVVLAPWEGPTLQLSMMQWRHLTKVLRASQGDRVTYTDGLGMTGEGRLGNQVVERGEETFGERDTEIVVASAPPGSKDRQRYLVEKLAELGVARLIWLDTKPGFWPRWSSPAGPGSWKPGPNSSLGRTCPHRTSSPVREGRRDVHTRTQWSSGPRVASLLTRFHRRRQPGVWDPRSFG
jgi:hypothetical protein